MKPNYRLPLILLFLFSLFTRLYHIDQLTLFGDEIDVGNQAYSLLKTGRDYKGNFLPFYVESFSEYRAPLYIYTALPGLALFGNNEIAVRFPSIIFGLTSIFLLYFLVKKITKDQTVSFFCALILSITPWHLHYSRTGFEVTLLLTLILAGTILFLHKKTFTSFIFFSLSFYTYNTANIFVPLLLLFLVFSQPKLPIKKYFLSSIVPFFLLLPLFFNILSGHASNRFKLISIFNNPSAVDQIIQKRTSFSSSQSSFERLFHNKAISYSKEFISNYVQSISPDFLFIHGDPNPRHSIPGFGLLPLICIPFLFIGLFKKTHPLFLFWLFIAPIASGLTLQGGNHATRLFLLLPPLCYFIAQGIVSLKNYSIFLLPLIFVSVIPYFHEYHTHYPKESFQLWNHGYKQAFQSIPSDFNRLFISNAYYSSVPHFVFYNQTDPSFIQSDTFSDIPRQLPGLQFQGFPLTDNIMFINGWGEDPISAIQQMAQPKDTFILFQLKDIPGDHDFSKQPIPEFNTIEVIHSPNQNIFAQIIQKI